MFVIRFTHLAEKVGGFEEMSDEKHCKKKKKKRVDDTLFSFVTITTFLLPLELHKLQLCNVIIFCAKC